MSISIIEITIWFTNPFEYCSQNINNNSPNGHIKVNLEDAKQPNKKKYKIVSLKQAWQQIKAIKLS